MKIDYRVVYEELKDKNKIEYLATKRVKNPRDCEVINFKEDFFNTEKATKINNSSQ